MGWYQSMAPPQIVSTGQDSSEGKISLRLSEYRIATVLSSIITHLRDTHFFRFENSVPVQDF